MAWQQNYYQIYEEELIQICICNYRYWLNIKLHLNVKPDTNVLIVNQRDFQKMTLQIQT